MLFIKERTQTQSIDQIIKRNSNETENAKIIPEKVENFQLETQSTTVIRRGKLHSKLQ